MPAKPKFSREEIIDAAIQVVKEKGMDALTARELAAKLGSSARPIFTVFKDMEELKNELKNTAQERAREYMDIASEYTPVLKKTAMQIIKFAIEEPKLFQLIYMSENKDSTRMDELFQKHIAYEDDMIEIIMNDYGLNREDAQALFRHTWIYNYGVSVLSATRMCDFSEEELNQLLGVIFHAMMMYIQAGRINDPTPFPEPLDQ
ncbi:MAG: TetR/AcrR family transcriptional regulator [Erysipelotrichaceae bacterium]|nr:TetR/AcrR family transcriptional regulator [Erysipelotrichaceae bacterium]